MSASRWKGRFHDDLQETVPESTWPDIQGPGFRSASLMVAGPTPQRWIYMWPSTWRSSGLEDRCLCCYSSVSFLITFPLKPSMEWGDTQKAWDNIQHWMWKVCSDLRAQWVLYTGYIIRNITQVVCVFVQSEEIIWQKLEEFCRNLFQCRKHLNAQLWWLREWPVIHNH